ncbi:MAG: M1 family aminopeptidase [Pirellulales bacterium]
MPHSFGCRTVYSRIISSLHSWLVLACVLSVGPTAAAQDVTNRKYSQEDKFRQLEEAWPTPGATRTATGEPGPEYWQQRADYVIDVKLDDKERSITGREEVTYHNNSPLTLRYLWLQLDANIFTPDSDASLTNSYAIGPQLSLDGLHGILARQIFDGGVKITELKDAQGKSLPYTVVKTMMRVDLPEPLAPDQTYRFSLAWHYKINDSKLLPGRTGYEYFEKDDNCIYEIAQWHPRMVAFCDAVGWQHKQFLGQGEFTLELGDYLVRITAPEDHIVAATGVLQNAGEVLTADQQSRLKEARTAKKPVFIVTPNEAAENQKEKTDANKTWVFHAQNVRDFAFASSRKFIWDAQGHDVEGNSVMAMSFYPNEAEPLWSRFSTHSIIHTLNVYSRYTFAYPYPTAISVNGPVFGMEYPMICFNGPRPEEDGTYSSRTKYALISVVIHEVGHNYFPMIVNSDERQWTWMDEGLNTFLQYLAEQEWQKDYPSQRGEPEDITRYMLSTDQVPIMTNSESLLQFGNNAYAKPATALNILRETILGRELFDFAFKEYARRWKFKRPMPADFFRTMEDASGIDLDWFWRGWFYSTDHCDIGIESVRWLVPDGGDPDAEFERKQQTEKSTPPTMSDKRNDPLPKRVEAFPELKDFYNSFDPSKPTPELREAYERFLKELKPAERELLNAKHNFYVVKFKNLGGLVMPVIVQLNYKDGTHQIIRIPAEIWRNDATSCTKGFVSEKELVSIELDPHRETADADRDNNHFPPKLEPSRFRLYKGRRQREGNPMRAEQERQERELRRKEEQAKREKEEQAKREAAEKKKAEENAKPAESADKEQTQSDKDKSPAVRKEIEE